MVREPDFLIVGTPRSGTTFVQRLVCELPGVRVPWETHFFDPHFWQIRNRYSFPLGHDDLVALLNEYQQIYFAGRAGLDRAGIAQIVDLLDGQCRDPVQLFSALLQVLASDQPVIGAKDPYHLKWWRPLSRALPNLKLICVVRDPRAVVASVLELGWASDTVVTASQWRDDVHRARAAAKSLGPQRCLLIRYEDAVSDPDTLRARFASFLGIDDAESLQRVAPEALFRESETWVSRAAEAPDPDRISVWTDRLSDEQQLAIAAVCRREMRDLGYDYPHLTAAGIAQARLRAGPATQVRLIDRWARNRAHDASIRYVTRDWHRQPAQA